MGEWILGLGGSDHDFSAVLMNGSDLRVAIEQERLSRRKHSISLWYEDPLQRAIDYCLQAEGISMDEITAVAGSDSLPAQVRHRFRDRTLRQFPHHLCHAASAYMMLPSGAKAGVLVYDGFGSVRGRVAGESLQNLRETFSFFRFSQESYQCVGHTTGRAYIEEDEFPIGVSNSIGMLYELVTALLGYDLMDSGKTMGLSSHGVPQYLELLEQFVTLKGDPENCFNCATDEPALRNEIERILLQRDTFRVRADLAASAQALVNKTLLHCEQFFRDLDIDYLCLSGGCALNTVANSFLVEHSELKGPIFIPPHCGDAGLGAGALWLTKFAQNHQAPCLTFREQPVNPGFARPGRNYSRGECQLAVLDFYPRLAIDSSVTSASTLATVLARSQIVGVLNGRSEIGPRALGGRSIFADPIQAITREKLNRVIKGREPFRPLAPIVLQSQYDEYFFDRRQADPFMLRVSQVQERCRREAPAVVHIDGTARVQVVPNDGDPFLIELLTSFQEITGRGLLINTSFNRRGEPIVETPVDAIDAFLGMGLDGLFMNGDFYRPIGE